MNTSLISRAVSTAPAVFPVARQRRRPRPTAGGIAGRPALSTATLGTPLLLLPPCGRAYRGPSFPPLLPRATEALEKPSAAPFF
jgi:hypothetical protein